MLIDDVKIEVTSGKGGDGRVVFNRTLMSLGPTGGRGGKGGDVYLQGVSDIGALAKFRNKKKFKASNGQPGGTQTREGKSGEDLILVVPVGTVVHGLPAGEEKEVTKIGQKIRIVEGGKGGRGNYDFRSPTNTSPKEFEEGENGKRLPIRLELKLIADVGFIGLPNVGKSSLLNELTNAKARVANYSFTTLEPNLGVFYELILADIPGLIEGASAGKGLGVKFLRHIERTNAFFHFISAQAEDPIADYKIIRRELGEYNPALLEKREYVLLSQADTVAPEVIKSRLKVLKKINPNVVEVSVIDDESLKKVKQILSQIIKEKTELDQTEL